MDLVRLHDAVAAVCPIDGLCGPIMPPAACTTYPASDGTQWRVDFAAGATAAQQQAGIGVLANYVDAPPVPTVTGRQVNGQARAASITTALNTVLTSTTSVAKPDDIRYFNSVGLDTRMPINNPKAARVLGLAGVKDVPAYMAAALLLPA